MNRAGCIPLLSGCLLMMAALGARPASPGKHVLISGTYMTSAVQSNLLALGHTSTAFGNIANVNFAGFNAIWLGLGAAGAANRTADLLSFVSAGGIVLVEGSNNSGLSAGLSFTNASGQTIRIIDTNHPVNAGLTAASLSHWGNSWWGYFSAVDGFTGLTDTGTYGQWVTVEKSVGAGHLVFTFQILSHFLENGAGGTGPASPKGIFLDNVLRLAPGTGTNRPTIVLQPQSLTNYTLFPLTLSVAAYGATPLNYRWFKEGTEIPGATNNIFTIGSLHLTNSGNYSVTVSNAYGSPKSAPATVLVLPRPDCAPISEGLISWWRWEKDLTDNWGVSTLLSTSSRSLSFSTGKVGQAISGALIVADSPALRPTNALSIEAWVLPFPSLIQDRRAIVSKYDTSRTATNSGYFLGINENGRLQFSISPNGSSQTINLMSPAVLPVQQWSFVVATYDGSSLRLYLNGALVSQTNHTAGIFPSTADLGLGATSVGIFSWTWNGLLDEVSIYRRGLLPAEISAIYNADISGKCLVPPTITLHPQSQAVPQGEDVQLTVDFSGTRPAHYQWKFMGTNLSGATNAALVLEKLDVNKVGNYSVLVSNMAGTSLSSEASISLLPPPSCIHPLSNAISWWPADGNAFDATGSNDLPFAAYSPGKAKQAFLLNGYTSRFQVPSATALNFGSNADFSIEAWIKALPPPPQSTTNPNVPIVEKRIGTGLNYGTGYSLSLYQGRLAFWLGAASSQPLNQALYVSPGPDLRDRMFHHVAVTLNRGLTNGGKLYLDGQLIHTFDPSARRGSLVNNGLFYLGGPASPVGNSYFNGLIDEVAVYDRALSAAEILNLRSAGAAGKCKVLPVVISQPVSQMVTIGSNVTFSVGVGGPSRLRYQWLRGLAVIAGATNESYTFNVQSGSAGSYSVRVSNAFGSILSSNALLTVNHRPSALPLALATEEDTALNLTLLGSDPEGSVLAFAVVQPPAHGQLSGLPPNLIYSP